MDRIKKIKNKNPIKYAKKIKKDQIVWRSNIGWVSIYFHTIPNKCSPQRILLVWNGSWQPRRAWYLFHINAALDPPFAQDIAGCSAIPFMSTQCITFQCISNLEDLKQGESSLYNSPKWKIGVHLDSFKKPLVLDQKVGSSQIWLLPQQAWWYHIVFHQKCMRLKTHGEVDLWVYRFYRIPIQHNSTRHPGKTSGKNWVSALAFIMHAWCCS